MLFGSLAGRGEGRDVDLLVMPRGGGGGWWRLELAAVVAEELGVDWLLVDVVEAGPDTPCPIVLDAWRRGRLVYEEEPGEARGWLLARVMVCVDYMVSAKRLGIPWVGVQAARRRWGGGGGVSGEADEHGG